MKRALTHSLLLLAFLAGFLLAYNFQAHAVDDSPPLVEKNHTILPDAPYIEVISSMEEFKPGQHMKWHYHHGVEVIYVIQGATVQLNGKAKTTFKTGTTLMIPVGVRHEGFKVIGKQNLKLFLVHIVERNKPLFDQKP